MRLAFFGTPDFAVPSLRALVAAGHDVALLVAQPDRPVGRGQKLASPPTIDAARALGLPTAQPTKIRTGEFPERLRALDLDAAVVVAYGRILTREHLTTPRLGCFNVHASLLPRWRGAAPIQWSILGGDMVTGVTTMQMAEGLDTGDMLLKVETPIGPEETAGELHDRLMVLGAELIVRTLAALPAPTPQDDSLATFAPMLAREMGRLDWTRSAVELHRQVRGLSPWPGTYTGFRGEVLKVLRARVAEGAGQPGEVLSGARIAAASGALELVEVQLPGRRPVSGHDWVNGSRVVVGEVLALPEAPK